MPLAERRACLDFVMPSFSQASLRWAAAVNPTRMAPGCTSSCGDASNGCIMCEPCSGMLVPVAPGGSVDLPWSGKTYSFRKSAGCACHDDAEAHAGKYAARVLVYSNIAESGWDAIEYFDLPSATGIVEVPLVKLK